MMGIDGLDEKKEEALCHHDGQESMRKKLTFVMYCELQNGKILHLQSWP